MIGEVIPTYFLTELNQVSWAYTELLPKLDYAHRISLGQSL